jgi:hypothetical protein
MCRRLHQLSLRRRIVLFQYCVIDAVGQIRQHIIGDGLPVGAKRHDLTDPLLCDVVQDTGPRLAAGEKQFAAFDHPFYGIERLARQSAIRRSCQSCATSEQHERHQPDRQDKTHQRQR